MKLSVVIPSYNEADSIVSTINNTCYELEKNCIEHEIVIVDDNSTDNTADIVKSMSDKGCIRYIRSPFENGFGLAVRAGLDVYSGDYVAVMMADCSDSPRDLVKYFNVLEEGYDCAFGSRFIKGAKVIGYPKFKKAINRLVNNLINYVFRLSYNDTTNAFKAYRREVIDRIQPLLSNHYNLTVEMPLKAVVRGYSYSVVPIAWENRKSGESKLKLNEMGSRYLFIVLSVLLERYLTKNDYRRRDCSGQRNDKVNAG